MCRGGPVCPRWIDTWVGPGVLVFNGDVFDFGDDTQRDPGRIIDAHPRLAASLARFAAGPASWS